MHTLHNECDQLRDLITGEQCMVNFGIVCVKSSNAVVQKCFCSTFLTTLGLKLHFCVGVYSNDHM